MKNDIRIIGLDLDGTVLNSKKQVSPRVYKAIAAAGRAGIHVLPATGRTISGVPQQLLEIPGVRYALTSNGAKIYELPGRREIYCDCFDTAAALELIRLCSATGGHTSAYMDGEGYCAAIDREAFGRIMDAHYLEYVISNRNIVPDLAAYVAQRGRPVEKLAVIYTDMAVRKEAWRRLEGHGGSLVTTSLPFNLEVNTPTADKGEGLLALGRLLGYEKGQIMAIGDGMNDVDMLRKVGHPVAMGNAEPEVKAVAGEVTLTNEEDGVAVVIERLLAG